MEWFAIGIVLGIFLWGIMRRGKGGIFLILLSLSVSARADDPPGDSGLSGVANQGYCTITGDQNYLGTFFYTNDAPYVSFSRTGTSGSSPYTVTSSGQIPLLDFGLYFYGTKACWLFPVPGNMSDENVPTEGRFTALWYKNSNSVTVTGPRGNITVYLVGMDSTGTVATFKASSSNGDAYPSALWHDWVGSASNKINNGSVAAVTLNGVPGAGWNGGFATTRPAGGGGSITTTQPIEIIPPQSPGYVPVGPPPGEIGVPISIPGGAEGDQPAKPGPTSRHWIDDIQDSMAGNTASQGGPVDSTGVLEKLKDNDGGKLGPLSVLRSSSWHGWVTEEGEVAPTTQQVKDYLKDIFDKVGEGEITTVGGSTPTVNKLKEYVTGASNNAVDRTVDSLVGMKAWWPTLFTMVRTVTTFVGCILCFMWHWKLIGWSLGWHKQDVASSAVAAVTTDE